MRPDQIELLTIVGTPAVHPDGAFALVAASQPSLTTDAYTGQLWRIALDGEDAPRRVTRGTFDAAPQFSPDGRLVAFRRVKPGERPQVWVAPASGGEAAQVTDAKLGVGSFCWSPDSRQVAWVARVPQEGRYGTLEGVEAAHEDPRRIDGYQFQANGLGWTRDRVRQLFVADVPDPHGAPPLKPVGRAAAHLDPDAPWSPVPQARQLTDGPLDVGQPAFTPDGEAVLVTTGAGDDPDSHLRSGIRRVPVAGGEPSVFIEDARVSFSGATWSTDGSHLFVLGTDLGDDGLDFVASNDAVHVTDAHGGTPRRLTDPESVEIAGELVAASADAVLAVRAPRGGSELLRVSADGTVETLWGGQPTVASAAPVPGSDAVVAAVASATSTGELARIASGALALLTDFAGPLRAGVDIVEPTELIATSADGTPVHGWVLTPPGPGPHPVLLTIHGGPYAAYGPDFFDEWQIYVGAGYAVVACNPRGAGTYGQAHGAAITHDFGNLDMADVLAFLDHATATTPGLDAARVGVMGGSYGGYLTAWIIAHEHRFAGAIVERGFLDGASFVGAADIGWFFPGRYLGTDRAAMDRQSPLLLADQVRTPTLVMHSELDLRCPLGQALRYYTQLKASGVETELLVFPGEDHELSRSGTPWHRRQRFEAILEWWGRHLPLSADDGAE